MFEIEAILERSLSFWEETVDIWLSGGWAMIVIAIIALVMFAMGMHVHLCLRKKGFRSVSEKKWRKWIEQPEKRKGPVGALLDYITRGKTLKETRGYCEQLHTTETVSIDRDLRVMKICVSTAPLVGLLGTVTGMLSTFGALATGSGGDKTMGLVAEGISEALITTETGLVIALPGLLIMSWLTSRFQAYKAFLAKLESVCMQTLSPKFRKSEEALARFEASGGKVKPSYSMGQAGRGAGNAPVADPAVAADPSLAPLSDGFSKGASVPTTS